MSHLSQQANEPVYYIVDCPIFAKLHLGWATFTVTQSMLRQEGFECTKECLRSYYPNVVSIYCGFYGDKKKLLNSHDELGMQNTSLSRKPSNFNIPSTIETQMCVVSAVWQVTSQHHEVSYEYAVQRCLVAYSSTACPMINITLKNSWNLVVACTPVTSITTHTCFMKIYNAFYQA